MHQGKFIRSGSTEVFGRFFVANHLNIVPVWTKDEGRVVLSGVVRSQAGCAIVFGTSLQGCAIKGLDLLTINGRKCQVEMA